MAKQQNCCFYYVGKIEFSMQHHNHIHKNLHSAMLAVWLKKNPAHGNGR